jgi:hypothetical protein
MNTSHLTAKPATFSYSPSAPEMLLTYQVYCNNLPLIITEETPRGISSKTAAAQFILLLWEALDASSQGVQ